MSARTQIKTEAAMGTQTPSGWRQAGFWVCIVVAVAAVVRRVLALANAAPGAAPQLAALDAFFASHAGLTLAHILPALAFVGLAPWVVYHRSAANGLPLRLMFPLGAVVGITAYAMAVDAFGGWVERSAVLVFNTLFLYSLSRAYWYLRHGEAPSQRRWMLRAIGVLLGIATTRPVMGIFFATSRLTHLEPRQFFGWAFWIGFSVNTLVVERWLRSTESPARMAASTPDPRT